MKPYLLAGGISAMIVGILSLATLSPTIGFWDSGEYVTAAATLGIPHAPGNPLFILLGRAWVVGLEFTEFPIASGVNLLAVLCAVVAAAVWACVALELMRLVGFRGEVAVVWAVGSAVIGFASQSYWLQANALIKLYPMVHAVMGGVILSCLIALRTSCPKRIVLSIYATALGATVHPMAVIAVPPLLLATVLVVRRNAWSPMLLSLCVTAILVPSTIFMVLPERARQGPELNQGFISCDDRGSALVSSLSWGLTGCHSLSSVIARRQFRAESQGVRRGTIGTQVADYAHYLLRQWADPTVSMIIVLMAAGGIVVLIRTDALNGLLVTLFLLGATLGLAWGLDLPPRFDLSIGKPGQDTQDRAYLFVVGFHAVGLLSGLGAASAIRSSVDGFRNSATTNIAVAGCLAGLIVAGNWSDTDRSSRWHAEYWARDVLNSLPEGGILVTSDETTILPALYLQVVKKLRTDVAVIPSGLLSTDWYWDQLASKGTVLGSQLIQAQSRPQTFEEVIEILSEQVSAGKALHFRSQPMAHAVATAANALVVRDGLLFRVQPQGALVTSSIVQLSDGTWLDESSVLEIVTHSLLLELVLSEPTWYGADTSHPLGVLRSAITALRFQATVREDYHAVRDLTILEQSLTRVAVR